MKYSDLAHASTENMKIMSMFDRERTYQDRNLGKTACIKRKRKQILIIVYVISCIALHISCSDPDIFTILFVLDLEREVGLVSKF